MVLRVAPVLQWVSRDGLKGPVFLVQVQIVALKALPAVPPYILGHALLEGEIGVRLQPCLANSTKEVRPCRPPNAMTA